MDKRVLAYECGSEENWEESEEEGGSLKGRFAKISAIALACGAIGFGLVSEPETVEVSTNKQAPKTQQFDTAAQKPTSIIHKNEVTVQKSAVLLSPSR